MITEKPKCTGCGACSAVCPLHCIEMKHDKEGFLYPTISDKCIHCGKCENVCPQNNKTAPNLYKQSAFAACSHNKAIWRRSSSGGAFSEICYAFGDETSLFVGAMWDNFYVCQIGINGFGDLKKLCKSKYIASDFGRETFEKIKAHLLDKKKVVFCGTPCQVAAIKSFLGREYDNLLLIDLICHGVGSPLVFQTCIENLEKQFSKKILTYEFRSKRSIYEGDHLQKVTFFDNSEVYLANDPFLQLFISQNCLRLSCGENCIYRNECRQGDITIGDFKELSYVFPQLSGAKQNFSTIVVNSVKGNSILPKLKERMLILPCSVDDIKRNNPLFQRHTYFSTERKEFFDEYIVSPGEAILKWTTPATVYKKSIKRKIYDLLPSCIRTFIWRRFHKK